MKRVLVVSSLLLASLVPAAAAGAGTVTMNGGVPGDSDSKVTLKVKVAKDGEPKKMKVLEYSGVDMYVSTAEGPGDPCAAEASGKFTDFSFHRGPAPSIYTWGASEQVNGLRHSSSGAMPYMNPKNARGYVVHELEDGSYCVSKDFKLKK